MGELDAINGCALRSWHKTGSAILPLTSPSMRVKMISIRIDSDSMQFPCVADLQPFVSAFVKERKGGR
jgi:hypothetical protein